MRNGSIRVIAELVTTFWLVVTGLWSRQPMEKWEVAVAIVLVIAMLLLEFEPTTKDNDQKKPPSK